MKFFFMRKAALLALLIAVLAPSQASAQYKALLKSGEELYASDYWVDKVDKEVIRLLTNGTMTRIPRSTVRYIAPVAPGDRRVRTAIKRITFAPKNNYVAALPETEHDDTPANSESRLTPPQDPKATAEFLRNEAERIDREREAAKNDFRKALNGGDFSMRQRTRQRILDLTEERSKLLEKVKVASSGVIPAWWRWQTED